MRSIVLAAVLVLTATAGFLQNVPKPNVPVSMPPRPAAETPLEAAVLTDQPQMVHPLWTADYQARRDSREFWPGLVGHGEGGQLLPNLAVSWQAGGSPTGSVWTVDLQPDLYWSDGQPFTAQDVVFTYAAIREPDYAGPWATIFTDLARVEARDEYTVRFTLTGSDPAFPARLAMGILPMHSLISTRAAAKIQQDFSSVPMVKLAGVNGPGG